MAWFKYSCPEHGEFRVSLPKREKTYQCKQCGLDSAAILSVGSVQVVERLDNGAMVRAVERLHNIDEIMSQRSTKHSKENRERKGMNEDDADY